MEICNFHGLDLAVECGHELAAPILLHFSFGISTAQNTYQQVFGHTYGAIKLGGIVFSIYQSG